MRPNADRNTYALLPVITALSLSGLAGCDKLTPNGASGTVALLRAGSEQACVAREVQDDLRGLILPKPAELGADGSPEDVRSAIGSVSLSFDATTLQSTDKTVGKVSCTTNVQVGGTDGDLRRFRIAYDVSPSAEDPAHVVVSADTDDAKTYARSAIGTALAHQTAAKAQQHEAVQANQAHQQLLALVTPKWLAGTWIDHDTDAPDCGNGNSYTFLPSHRVTGNEMTGHWSLSGDHLRAVGTSEYGRVEAIGTIIAADASSFTLLYSFGGQHDFERCRSEDAGTGVSAQPDALEPVTATPPT